MGYLDEIGLTRLWSKIKLIGHPVGSIYMSVDPTNPSQIFGGTWVSWGAGQVPVGVDSTQTEFSTVEKTGGAKTVDLSTANLPSHTHSFAHTHGTPSTSISSSGVHTHSTTAKTVYDVLLTDGTALKWGDATGSGSLGGIVSPSRGSKQLAINIPALSITSSGAHTHTVPAMTTNSQSTSTSGGTGSGTAHNNLQPYITCYMWKRTA